MSQHHHHLKRLQHSTHSFNSRTSSPNDESIENFATMCNNLTKLFSSFKPGPNRARRGGARTNDRHWCSSTSLPKRAINYDLAESFVDHSTNPLSSDLYKIRFKHSTKQWPNGRFRTYKEKLDKFDGNITDVICTRSFPIVPKRKRTEQNEQNNIDTTSSIVLLDPIAQEQKKKLADKQTNLYANLFGCGKIPRLPSTAQIKKTNDINSNPTKSPGSNSLTGENKEDQQC